MRIIIKNLPKDITKEKITKEFRSYGEITDVEFPKENRQFCFVGYRNSESADKAVKDMNKSYIKNYRINVELVKKDEYEEKTKRLKKLLNKDEEEKYLNTLKLKVTILPECTEKELKAIYKSKECHIDEGSAIVVFDNIEDSKQAQKIDIVLGKRVRYDKYVDEKDDTHYNSLFFDFTTIIEKMCGQQKIKKEELLNLEDKDLGSKIAILESHLVEQTKKWLEENDIDITTNYKKVNKRVLLIRNFDVINQLEINGKIKISPSKTMAIVKFDTEEEAKKAYNRYMLKRVNDKAIYCEFLKTGDKEEIKVKTSNKLVIKNIPFQANENDIAKIIESQVKIVTLRLPKKRDGTIRGFCFVELGSEEEAKLVIEKFGTSTHLYGRRLVFQYADQ